MWESSPRVANTVVVPNWRFGPRTEACRASWAPKLVGATALRFLRETDPRAVGVCERVSPPIQTGADRGVRTEVSEHGVGDRQWPHRQKKPRLTEASMFQQMWFSPPAAINSPTFGTTGAKAALA